MTHIVGVMNEIIKDYVGADKPLEYAFVNQQVSRNQYLPNAAASH